MDDNKLALEEARRAGQHDVAKAQAEGEVQAEIAEQAAERPRGERERIGALAGEFRAQAVDEVVETDREVKRARGAARVSQVVDYIFFVIYGLLGLRFLLALLAARSTAGFVKIHRCGHRSFLSPVSGHRRESHHRWRAHLDGSPHNRDRGLSSVAPGN
jgi:hypothetical protein